MKKTIFVILFVIGFFILTILLWIGWQYVQDPLDIIDYPSDNVELLTDSTFHLNYLPADRIYQDLHLKHFESTDLKVTLSSPKQIPEKGLPVVIILGGLEVGHYTLRYIPDPGNNIVVIYQYPYHPENWYEGTVLGELPVIRESVLLVPSQVVALYRWISEQSWADAKRISITGYSFGALFMPAIYHLAQRKNVRIDYGVIAYGGLDLYQLLVTNMTNVFQPLRSVISWLAATAIRGAEPSLHASHLNSEFLLINGTLDHQIPNENWQRLHQLVPEPKTIIILEEGHMHHRKTDLTKKLVNLSQSWLLQKKMINP